MQVYAGHPLLGEWLKHPASISTAQQAAVDELIEKWRIKLCVIDWFVRRVNETIARIANDEDQLQGRF